MTAPILNALLSPEAIAVVGASRKPHKVGHEIVANLINAKFEGRIVPVNPTADEILGLRCYPNAATCDKPIDLSIIALPSASVLAAVKDSLNAGAKAICAISAGFKEVGN